MSDSETTKFCKTEDLYWMSDWKELNWVKQRKNTIFMKDHSSDAELHKILIFSMKLYHDKIYTNNKLSTKKWRQDRYSLSLNDNCRLICPWYLGSFFILYCPNLCFFHHFTLPSLYSQTFATILIQSHNTYIK